MSDINETFSGRLDGIICLQKPMFANLKDGKHCKKKRTSCSAFDVSVPIGLSVRSRRGAGQLIQSLQ